MNENELKTIIDSEPYDLSKNTYLTQEEMDQVLNVAAEENVEARARMEKAIATPIPEEENADEDGIAKEIRDVRLDDSLEDLIAGKITEEQYLNSDTNLFDIAKGAKPEISDEKVVEIIKASNSEADFEMSDDDTMQFLSAISKYRRQENCNYYNELPKKFQDLVNQLLSANGMTIKDRNAVAKFIIGEFVSQAELDQIFIDFETSLNEALNIPSIGDLYSEHTREVMEVKIPEIIEKIKDTEPENAKLLEDIRDRFTKSYDMSLMKEHFESNARTRKLMRRDWTKYLDFCSEYNLRNSRSNFKMPDCRGIANALNHVFLDNPPADPEDRINKMNITEKDISKFIVLFCRVPIAMDPSDILDAAYMYYALRNIMSLNMTNDNKTSFTAELINNICDIIEFIRKKEAEFSGSK